MCSQVSNRSLMPRIHLPVSTDKSAISSNTGSGANVISGPKSFVNVRQASVGLPLIIMPQLPQMPARQTKSNSRDGSCFSRISIRAMNSVICSASSISYVCMRGMLPGSCGLKRRTLIFSWRATASVGILNLLELKLRFNRASRCVQPALQRLRSIPRIESGVHSSWFSHSRSDHFFGLDPLLEIFRFHQAKRQSGFFERSALGVRFFGYLGGVVVTDVRIER